MRSRLRCVALSAAALLAAVVHPAIAAEPYDANKGWTYLGGSVFGYKGDPKRDADAGWGSHAFIGLRVPGGLRFEVDAWGLQGNRDSDDGKDSSLAIGGNLLLPLMSGGNAPFLMIGGGHIKEKVLGSKQGTGYANVGVGGLLPLTDFLNLRVEARYVEVFNDFADTRGDGPLYDVQLGLGLQAELGRPVRRKIVDADHDGVPD